MIELSCPKCGASFKVEDAMAGKEVMCTECASISVVSPAEGESARGEVSSSPLSSRSAPYAPPRAAQPPRYISLRLVASLHFIFGAVCFIAGAGRLALLAYQRWLKGMDFYVRGPTILRTFAVAAVGLFLLGMGTLLHCLRDLAINRFYQRR